MTSSTAWGERPVSLEASSRSELTTIGNHSILADYSECLTALFCSSRCPGDVILSLYDIARAMRDARAPIVSGFQSPMERECLRILLRGEQPIVVCPARGIESMRIPSEWRGALEQSRLVIASPFPATLRRPTVASAQLRNEFVASLAPRVFIAHAAPGGKTEAFARRLAETGKPLFTIDSPANTNLMKMGALAVSADTVNLLAGSTVSDAKS